MTERLLHLLTIVAVLCTFNARASKVLVITDEYESEYIGHHLSYFEDVTNARDLSDIATEQNFTSSEVLIPNLPLSKNTFWVKFTVQNESSTEDFKVLFDKIDLVELCFYDPESPQLYEQCYYRDLKFKDRPFPNVNYEFAIQIPEGKQKTFYIKMKSKWNVTFPVKFGTSKQIDHFSLTKENFLTFYFGILIAMFFYNLFIYITVKDRAYLIYIIYIFSLTTFQLAYYNQGYKYFWPNYPLVTAYMIKLGAILVALSAIFLTKEFLHLKKYQPKFNRFMLIYAVFVGACFVFCFTDDYNDYFNRIFNIVMLVLSILVLTVSIIVMRKQLRPTIFFLGGWSILILFQIQFNLSNLEIIPYFKITNYSLIIGSIFEVVLLSFALADNINNLKISSQASQKKTIKLLEEREQLAIEQKMLLEKKVNERTFELQQQNEIIKEQNEKHKALLKEIHHRVKNNLQIVNSLLRLQSYEFDDEKIIAKFDEAQQRVISLALLHEKMYQSEDLEHINVGEHYRLFVQELIRSYGGEDRIQLLIDCENIILDLKTLVPLGLIINEVVTNSMKYAFDKNETGIIRLSIKPLGKKMYELIIGDNGKGMDDMSKFDDGQTLGFELIKTFTEQLNGKVSVSAYNGFYYTIIFEGDN